MTLTLMPYVQQVVRWPASGRVILAQFDEQSVVVYQAYAPAIARFALENGWFGGPFRLTRMSWIKPNFLWMMYRSGWGTKADQEAVLAIRLRRSAFDSLLATAVHTSFRREVYADEATWRHALHAADVQLQWDPDHDPHGKPLERRALQLGLRGAALEQYARDWILGIEDVSGFVAEQREVLAQNATKLMTPREDIYPALPAVRSRLGLAAAHDGVDAGTTAAE